MRRREPGVVVVFPAETRDRLAERGGVPFIDEYLGEQAVALRLVHDRRLVGLDLD